MNGFIKTALTEARTQVASVSGWPMPTSRFRHPWRNPSQNYSIVSQFWSTDSQQRTQIYILNVSQLLEHHKYLKTRLKSQISLRKHTEQTAQKPEEIRKQQWWFYWKEGNKRKLKLKRANGRREIWKKIKQQRKAWVKRCDGSVCWHHTVGACVVKTRLAPSYRGGKSTLFSHFPRAPHKPRKMGAIQ